MHASREKSFFVGAIFGAVCFSLVKFGVSFPWAMVAAAAVTPAIGYWIPPRPPVSFHRYFIGLELIVFVVVIAFWLIPMLLRPLVPIQWVYALGSLFLSLRLYFILLILWPSLREIGFLKWAMACLVLALVVAGVMTYIRHVNSGIG